MCIAGLASAVESVSRVNPFMPIVGFRRPFMCVTTYASQVIMALSMLLPVESVFLTKRSRQAAVPRIFLNAPVSQIRFSEPY